MENNSDILKKRKVKEYNQRYYKANKDAIKARVTRYRKGLPDLVKAKWYLNYWQKQVDMLEEKEKIDTNER